MQWKRGILALILGIVGMNFGYGYEPHPEEIQQLTTLKAQLSEISDDQPQVLWSLYQQLRDFASLVPSPASLNYQLQHLRNFLLDKLESRIQVAKTSHQAEHQSFLDEHRELLSYADSLSPNCYGWYTTLDMMSFAYDFPTALTIAVWRKESSCGFYLPKNGDGPFQIVNKDYGAWPLDRAGFELTIKDFLEFSKRKIDRYNSKNPDTPIKLSYEHINYQDLLKFAGLYNGLSGASIYGDITPAAPRYFFDKMPGEFENGKRNWLFLQVLRMLEWELTQSK